MDITLIASTHHDPVNSLSEKFIPHSQEFEKWDSWEALAKRHAHFIDTFGHEEIENTILNPNAKGLRQVVWKATKFGGKYYKIVFHKVVRDEYEQV